MTSRANRGAGRGQSSQVSEVEHSQPSSLPQQVVPPTPEPSARIVHVVRPPNQVDTKSHAAAGHDYEPQTKKPRKRENEQDVPRIHLFGLFNNKHPTPGYEDEFIESAEFLAKRTADRMQLAEFFNNKSRQELFRLQTFPMVCCQTYCKITEGNRAFHLPAEIYVVPFSIDGRTHTEVGGVMPLLYTHRAKHPEVLSQEYIHGISGIPAPDEYPKGARDFATDLWKDHGRLYCFKREWLEVLGSLEYISRETTARPLLLHPEINLVCIEDLLTTAISYQGLSNQDTPNDLKKFVLQNYDDWKAELCNFHAEKLHNQPIIRPKKIKMHYRCARALSKGAIVILQRFMTGRYLKGPLPPTWGESSK